MFISILYQHKRLKSIVAEKSVSREAQLRSVITLICAWQRPQMALSRVIVTMQFARHLTETRALGLRHEGVRHQS
jgi:hypothetical protein